MKYDPPKFRRFIKTMLEVLPEGLEQRNMFEVLDSDQASLQRAAGFKQVRAIALQRINGESRDLLSKCREDKNIEPVKEIIIKDIHKEIDDAIKALEKARHDAVEAIDNVFKGTPEETILKLFGYALWLSEPDAMEKK